MERKRHSKEQRRKISVGLKRQQARRRTRIAAPRVRLKVKLSKGQKKTRQYRRSGAKKTTRRDRIFRKPRNRQRPGVWQRKRSARPRRRRKLSEH
eukprot:741804-Karenia_brevis.AAC.1